MMTDPNYMNIPEVERMFAAAGPGWAAQMERQRYSEPALVTAFLEWVLQKRVIEAPLLDLGCGSGLAAPGLRPLCRRLEGIDLSPSMLEVAGSTGLYDELHQGEAVPFLRSRMGYGGIVASGVACFFSDLYPLFEVVEHALQPGSPFVFTNDTLLGPGDVAASPRSAAMYLQSVQHIAEAAGRARLQVLSYQRCTVRLDFRLGQPVDGAVTVLGKV
jgi:predicted TPR repeat methyltransferase